MCQCLAFPLKGLAAFALPQGSQSPSCKKAAAKLRKDENRWFERSQRGSIKVSDTQVRTPSPAHPAELQVKAVRGVPRFIPHPAQLPSSYLMNSCITESWEITNQGCFMLLNLKLICYTAIDNWYKQAIEYKQARDLDNGKSFWEAISYLTTPLQRVFVWSHENHRSPI